MQRTYVLFLAILLFSSVAVAQGPAGAGSGRESSAGSSTPHPFFQPDLSDWQLSFGYQYNRINLIGSPFATDGVNITLTRFFNKWIGVDGQIGTGFFGNTGTTTNPPNLGVNSLFAGAGPRVAYRGHGRIEPWVHVAVGLEHFRFTQTASSVLGSNSGLGGVGGGGVDFLINQHFALRAEADVLETRFFSNFQRSFQGVGGVVVNF